VTQLDTTREETTHRWATFLPDGNRFFYYSRTGPSGTSEEDVVYLGSLDSSVNRILLHHNGNVAYAQGHLLYVRETTLMAQPFDLDGAVTTGPPFPLAEGIRFNQRFNSAVFTVSANGALAYLTGNEVIENSLIWVDREGRVIDTVGEPGFYWNCRLSPDGKRLAVDLDDAARSNRDVWVYDLTRGIKTRITFDSTDSWLPLWSPDGKRIAFTAERATAFDLFVKPADGTGEAELLLATDATKRPMDWSADGRFILYRSAKSGEDDTWVLPMSSGAGVRGEPIAFQKTSFDEDAGCFSPDGRWIAYSSNESGRLEVYVRPFPDGGGKWQVSTQGGDLPRWSRDGKEIFYLSLTDQMVVAQVDGSQPSFDVGTVRPLFETNLWSSASPYDVSADGQRFILVAMPPSGRATSVSIIQNWDAEHVKQ
jgi:dipeptidyl aminopeptidase/acylaminoacyl peptidase